MKDMDTQKSEIWYTNCIGEEFYVGDRAYYRPIDSMTIDSFIVRAGSTLSEMPQNERFTDIAKNPGSLLIVTNKWFETYGYDKDTLDKLKKQKR